MDDSWNNFTIAEHVSQIYLTMAGVYLLIAGLIATVGNVTVILTFFCDRKVQTNQQNKLLVNMAFADLGISISGYPWTTASNLHGQWLFNDAMCRIYGFFCFLFSMVSVGSLTGLALYRHIVMCRRQYVGKLNRRNTLLVVTGCWAYGLFWAVMPLAGWSSYTYENYGTACSCNWNSNKLTDITFNVASILLCFIIPLSFMLYCYVKMCIVMVCLFVLVWAPYAVLSAFAPLIELPINVTILPTHFAKLGPCCNCIVYFMMNPQYRAAVKRVFCQCLFRVTPVEDKLVYYSRRPKQNVFVCQQGARFEPKIPKGEQTPHGISTHLKTTTIETEISNEETAVNNYEFGMLPDILATYLTKGVKQGRNFTSIKETHEVTVHNTGNFQDMVEINNEGRNDENGENGSAEKSKTCKGTTEHEKVDRTADEPESQITVATSENAEGIELKKSREELWTFVFSRERKVFENTEMSKTSVAARPKIDINHIRKYSRYLWRDFCDEIKNKNEIK